MKDGVSVEEDAGINILREHLMHKEPGRGTHPEHALHVTQVPGIRERH